MQMHRQEDQGMFSQCFCDDASCRDVVPTFESAGQRKWKFKKKKTEKREKGLLRKKGGRDGWTDRE